MFADLSTLLLIHLLIADKTILTGAFEPNTLLS